MSKALRSIFLVTTIILFLIGAPLLLAPGRVLDIFAWQAVDPILTRLLGASLLAMAWATFFSWRASNRSQVEAVIQMKFAFYLLGLLGVLRHLLTGAYYAPVIWILFGLLVVGTLIWGFVLIRRV